jgi:hypothetical protein
VAKQQPLLVHATSGIPTPPHGSLDIGFMSHLSKPSTGGNCPDIENTCRHTYVYEIGDNLSEKLR